MDFLKTLSDDLRVSLSAMPETYRSRHATWLANQQRPNGGFSNRRGRAELYYTTFGVRSLSILNALTLERARAAGMFLAAELDKENSLKNAVETVSWWDALRLCEGVTGFDFSEERRIQAKTRTRETLEKLRRDDGGWAKTEMEGNGSLYHTFLAVCTYGRMGEDAPEVEKVDPFMASLAGDEGGFLENKYSKRPGVNGSAAGIGLSLLRKVEGVLGRAAVLAGWRRIPMALRKVLTRDLAHHARFLKNLRNEEGGFQATPNAPFADLLSTYTGLFGMRILGAQDGAVLSRAVAFARTLEMADGGYVGFALEQDADCEYTFYGLGVESLGLESNPQG